MKKMWMILFSVLLTRVAVAESLVYDPNFDMDRIKASFAPIKTSEVYDWGSLLELNAEADVIWNQWMTDSQTADITDAVQRYQKSTGWHGPKIKSYKDRVRAFLVTSTPRVSTDYIFSPITGVSYHPLFTQMLIEIIAEGFPFMPIERLHIPFTSITKYDIAPHGYGSEAMEERFLVLSLFPLPQNGSPVLTQEMADYYKSKTNWNKVMQTPLLKKRLASLMAVNMILPITRNSKPVACSALGISPQLNAKVLYSTFNFNLYIADSLLDGDPRPSVYHVEYHIARAMVGNCLGQRGAELYQKSMGDNIGSSTASADSWIRLEALKIQVQALQTLEQLAAQNIDVSSSRAAIYQNISMLQAPPPAPKKNPYELYAHDLWEVTSYGKQLSR